MKPLLTLIVFGTSLAIVAATVPSTRGPLLNAAVATAWAQQDRGRGDKPGKEREEKNTDHDRGDKGRGREDRDTDRGGRDKGGKGKEDRDTDRGGGDRGNTSEARDTDRGGGDKGRGNEDRDTDRGGGDKGKGNEDRGSDRGGGDKGRGNEDRGSDRGGGDKGTGNEDRGGGDIDRGGGKGNQPEDRGGDRGGGRNDDRADRGNDRSGSNGNEGRGPGGDNRDNGDNNAGGSGGGSGSGSGGTGTGGGPIDGGGNAIDIGDRGRDPADRVTGNAIDRDVAQFAGRYDLDDTETFDNDGFLARRGEIIAMSSDSLLRRRAEALGLQVVQQEFLTSLNTTMYRISVPAASPIDGILARLRAQDPEGVFDRNHLYDRSSSDVTSQPGSSSRPLLSTAKGITVGLIDTGVNALHPALHGTHVQLNYFVDQSRELPETHGTAVVSLMVSKEFGMLPDAQLYVACVFYEDRRGTSLSEARDLVRALDWLMKLRVPVINMSLSGPPNAVLRAAIQRALDAGHLIVAAVGNGGPASPPLYPAAYDGVIAVTAVDGGQHVYRRASRGSHVQLSAMGVDVVAAAPAGLATYSGTSFASPYVAALAAMDYRSLDPQKALEVKESLQANALDLGKPGRDEVYGYGLARPRSISTAAR